jgi:hypothetical protein
MPTPRKPRDNPPTKGAVPLPGPALTMQDLYRAVDAARPRIGQPVFVRYTRSGGTDADAMVALLARMVADAQAWIGRPPQRLWANGSPRRGQVCLTVQFQAGATALVSYDRVAAAGEGLDLLILGNHGSMMYDSGTGLSGDTPLPYTPEQPADPEIQAAITRSLESGEPQALTAS